MPDDYLRTTDLSVPGWLSSKWPGIADLARRNFRFAVERFADAGGFPAMAIRRLTADPRMEKVWGELFKKSRGDGSYFHQPNRRYMHAHPHWKAIDALSEHKTETDCLQEQACMLIFSVASGTFLYDRDSAIGPRTRTITEVNDETDTHRHLARRLREVAGEAMRLGYPFARKIYDPEGLVNDMASLVDQQAQRRQSIINISLGNGSEMRNPWIVERAGRTSTDPRLRGFVIEMVSICRGLFGSTDKDVRMPGVIAGLTSVVFARKITEASIRGMTTPPALKRRR